MKLGLYPLRFKPILQTRIWGGTFFKADKNLENPVGESWEISAVPGNVSVVETGWLKEKSLVKLIEMYAGELLGHKIINQYGRQFPILVKFLDTAEELSIQVHPDDVMAAELHQANGKEEMWYIMNNRKDSKIVLGLKEGEDKTSFSKALQNKNPLDVLNQITVKTGDVFHIRPGTVHAIGKNIMLAEIQQTSDITYRFFDYDRRDSQGEARKLNVDRGLKAIKSNLTTHTYIKYALKENQTLKLVDSPNFITSLMILSRPFQFEYSANDSFVILMCVEGAAQIQYKNDQYNLAEAQTYFLPAALGSVEIMPADDKCKILFVHL